MQVIALTSSKKALFSASLATSSFCWMNLLPCWSRQNCTVWRRKSCIAMVCMYSMRRHSVKCECLLCAGIALTACYTQLTWQQSAQHTRCCIAAVDRTVYHSSCSCWGTVTVCKILIIAYSLCYSMYKIVYIAQCSIK
jgi:hypothetical protein